MTIEELDRSSPVTLSEAMTARLSRAADAGEGTHRRLPSGGHDAMNFESAGVPVGLLFVPSIDSISHSPDETTDDDVIAAAVRMFARASLDTDEGIDPEAVTGDGDGHTTSANMVAVESNTVSHENVWRPVLQCSTSSAPGQ